MRATADAGRLGRALAGGSCVLVAATVPDGGGGGAWGRRAPPVDLSGCDALDPPRGAPPPLPGWPRGPGGPERLVGFARASTDFRIVATIDDVAVAPELQGRGVGRRMVERLLRELGRLGVEDVAVSAPGADAAAFFAGCGFGGDPLGAVPMQVPLPAPGGGAARQDS